MRAAWRPHGQRRLTRSAAWSGPAGRLFVRTVFSPVSPDRSLGRVPNRCCFGRCAFFAPDSFVSDVASCLVPPCVRHQADSRHAAAFRSTGPAKAACCAPESLIAASVQGPCFIGPTKAACCAAEPLILAAAQTPCFTGPAKSSRFAAAQAEAASGAAVRAAGRCSFAPSAPNR